MGDCWTRALNPGRNCVSTLWLQDGPPSRQWSADNLRLDPRLSLFSVDWLVDAIIFLHVATLAERSSLAGLRLVRTGQWDTCVDYVFHTRGRVLFISARDAHVDRSHGIAAVEYQWTTSYIVPRQDNV